LISGGTTDSLAPNLLKVTARERNIALAASLAAIFKALLAVSIIGAEISYTEDFEVEAQVPGLLASVMGLEASEKSYAPHDSVDPLTASTSR
jgi:H+/Cl- antiporter ClcA